jgi:hypothetical protein
MDFDVRSLSTRLSELDGIPRILGAIASLETRKLASVLPLPELEQRQRLEVPLSKPSN